MPDIYIHIVRHEYTKKPRQRFIPALMYINKKPRGDECCESTEIKISTTRISVLF